MQPEMLYVNVGIICFSVSFSYLLTLLLSDGLQAKCSRFIPGSFFIRNLVAQCISGDKFPAIQNGYAFAF